MNLKVEQIITQLEQHARYLKLLGIHEVPDVVSHVSEDWEEQDEVPVASSERESSSFQSLLELKKEVMGCVRCRELAGNRRTVVFGSGHAHAELVFVGEAPGFHEDQEGLPFVGKAGALLTKMIEAMGMKRNEVFICNVLKCRPPHNRNPLPEEIANCQPFLHRQLDLIKPKAICALGNFAAQTLLQSLKPVSKLRGETHRYRGIPLIVTFHPAYLLRNPQDKRKAWEDLKELCNLLGRKVPT